MSTTTVAFHKVYLLCENIFEIAIELNILLRKVLPFWVDLKIPVKLECVVYGWSYLAVLLEVFFYV